MTKAPWSGRLTEPCKTSDAGQGPITASPFSLPERSHGCVFIDKPTTLFWYRVFVEPTVVDFGFASVGQSSTVYVLHRYDESHTLSEVDIDNPSFSVTIVGATLPLTCPPGYEVEAHINIVQAASIFVKNSPITFTFISVPPLSAICYVSAVFAVVLFRSTMYGLWDVPSTAQKISYHFDTEVKRRLTGGELRLPRLAHTVRKTTIRLFGIEEMAFEAEWDAIHSARYAVIVPLFPLRVRLAAPVSSGATSIEVTDATDFEVGHTLIIADTLHAEAAAIEQVSGNTISLTGQLQYDYSVNLTWAYPALVGLGSIQRTRSTVGHRLYDFEINVTEAVPYDSGQLPTPVTLKWVERPRQVEVVGSVIDARSTRFAETGVAVVRHGALERVRDRLRIEHTYTLQNKKWRNLWNIFRTALGRAKKLEIATWQADLVVAEDAPAGAGSLKVRPESYHDIWGNYKQLLIDYGFATQEVEVTGCAKQAGFCTISISSPLEHALPAGSPIHFRINAYFADDSLEFDFKNSLVCIVTVGWEESYD